MEFFEKIGMGLALLVLKLLVDLKNKKTVRESLLGPPREKPTTVAELDELNRWALYGEGKPPEGRKGDSLPSAVPEDLVDQESWRPPPGTFR